MKLPVGTQEGRVWRKHMALGIPAMFLVQTNHDLDHVNQFFEMLCLGNGIAYAFNIVLKLAIFM